MVRLGTLFSGGGGFDIGARAAGLQLAWGVEYVPEIAEWANAQLGDHVRISDLTTADPAAFGPIDWLHASPPCPQFSVANRNKGETKNDLDLARSVARFIRYHQPRFFSLENVIGYRKSRSWAIIADELNRNYGFIVEHLNAADFGVPQKRRRMIVRAVRGAMWSPPPMQPTHNENGAGGLPAWIGWYAAIEDLIDTLPESSLAPWQIKRLREANVNVPPVLLGGDNASTPGRICGVLVDGDNAGKQGPVFEYPHRPVKTVSKTSTPRILVEGSVGGKRPPKLMDGSNPAFTVKAGSGGDRVLIERPPGYALAPTLLRGHEPANVVRSSRSDVLRLIERGDIRSLTPRCLARFQTFPDWYELPDKKNLATTMIGNAVPPLLARRTVESLIGP